MSALRHPVRLGMHGGESVFGKVQGLHDAITGLAVVGGAGTDDPEVMFEEHGTGDVCQYFADLGVEAMLNEDLGPHEPRPDIRERTGSEDLRVAWHAMRAAFLIEQPAYVNAMVRSLRERHESDGGAVALIGISRRFQRRTGTIRMLHTARAQPERAWLDIVGGPHPLEHHASGADIFRSGLYVPLVLLGSPFARGFVAGRAIVESTETVLLVVMGARSTGAVLRDLDVTWRNVYEDTLPDLRVLDGQGTTWLRQTNHHAVNLDAGLLMRWWTAQLNALFTEATDLGRYRLPDGHFDAGNAYRELRSLDRIISNCARIQIHPDEHALRVAVAFEFFDLLPNILDKKVRAAHVWGTLVNPSKAGKLLHQAFAAAPTGIRDILVARTDAVLAKLREETLEHVMPGRLQRGRVTIGAAGDGTLQADDFIANVFHQLRNTHHGYELDHGSKRDLLDAHTGHISLAFPELVVLYVLAILAQPREVLAGAWF